MIHFEWPWMLLAAPLPWLVARGLPPARPYAAALFLPFAAQVAERSAPAAPRAARWRVGLFALIWLLLMAAAVRPQWIGDPQPVASTGRRLLLAIDVSGSMAARDMAGRASRLEVVKQLAGEFIRRRHGDQVGLILFGTRPYLQAPLSTDLDTVDQFLQEATIGMAGPATALGDAIGLALKRLHIDHDRDTAQRRVSTTGETVLVLLTDGSSNAGEMPPVPAAKLAAASRLRIYTIGVGGGGDEDSDLDEATLKTIATETGGAYFRATDAAALQQAYARMDRLEPAAADDRWVNPSDEWFVWPLALALLLSLPAAVLREPRWT
ncbi:MAG: VWA domain-containing protein [Pseudomonadota bacterium]|nr:VWA domain-containing protein [Pseudomonadota bacterium]